MIRVLLPIALLAAAACSRDEIDVRAGAGVADYNHGKLQAAIQKFVSAGRTPQAYGELWHTILVLRPDMDRSTAELAELSIVTLALGPIKSIADRPMKEQIDTLALTVWPILLANEIEADEILRKRDTAADDVLSRPDETPTAYLQRICGSVLAAECKHVVPAFQGEVVDALVIRRATDRARNAVADCMLCTTDPGWKAAVAEWVKLDRQVNTWIHDVETKSDPANWPIAGAASEPDPGLPEAEITDTGEVISGGQRYGANTRLDALRDLRFMHGADSPIALHLRPDLELEKVRAILADVRKSGAKKIAVIARGSNYPWDRRIYWLSDVTGIHTNLRRSDPLQLLLHAIDYLGQPGDTAHVD